MENDRGEYVPTDLTQIDAGKPEALEYWAQALETDPEKIRQAVGKVGPGLDQVKQELGMGGV